jgi:outer membrane receptor protein involved in Fe transport
VSGNVAVVYDIRPDWMSYLNFGTGFRSPDLGERFQSTVVTVVTTQTVLGNPNLTPERSYSAEWGSKYEGENWQVRGAVFVNQVDNFIGTVQINPLTQQFQNVGNVMFYGTELEATVNPVDRVELFGNVGRTWTSNNTLARVANWTFNYGAAYTQPMAGFFDQARLVLYARTVMRSTDQTTAPNVEYGGFTTLNLQATFDFSIPSIETQGSLLVGVSNLANRSYREPFFNQIQPARSFYTALSFQF